MKVSRRHVLVSGAMLAGTLPVAARALGTAGGVTLVFDSRQEQSCAWARARTGPAIDVAQSGQDLWRALRDLPPGHTVAGCTRWSEFLVVRGQLRESGRRLRHAWQHAGCVEWVMSK